MEPLRTRTDRFHLTIGVTPGYSHDNRAAAVQSFLNSVTTKWQKLMEEEKRTNKVFVSAVATASLAVYPTDQGCPSGGEHVVTFQGTRNPFYEPKSDAWKEGVLRIAAALQGQLEQSTAQVDFQEVELVYFPRKEKEAASPT